MGTGSYVFRTDGDTENPNLTRLYGVGITRGLDVEFTSPNLLLTIICEGSRRDGDAAVDKMLMVTYRGFVIPEIEGGVRNWRFHDGRMTKIPVYATAVSVDTSGNKIRFNDPSGILAVSVAVGDTYKVIAEGSNAVTQPAVPAPLVDEHAPYYIKSKTLVSGTTFDIDLSLTVGGAAIDLTTVGAGTIRIYKANAGFDDPDQGRPQFWPGLDFTLSGIAYIEMQVPARFQTDFAPDDMRYIVQGKKLRDFTVDPSTDIITLNAVGTATYGVNNALEILDFYLNDAKMPTSYTHLGITVPRFRGQTWKDYRDRCNATLPWTSGPQAQGTMQWITTNGPMTVDNTIGSAQRTTFSGGHANAVGRAILSTEKDYSVEITMVAGQIIPGFVSTNVGANPGNISGLLLAPDGKLYYNTALGNTQIGTWANGDRIKFAIENRVFVGYQNGVRLVGVPATVAPASTMYFQCHGSDGSNAAISSAIVVPGSAGGAPINIPRFTSNVVYPQPTLMQDAVDGVLKRSPGVEKQDVNGALKMLTDMTRAEAFFFKYDPDTSVVSNIVQAGVKMTRIDPENRTNFYRAVIRDTQDMFLKQVPVFVDRDQLRSDVGGTLRDSGLLQFGVMNQSEGQRILSAQARLLSDLPVFATINSFFQSYVAAIGDYVNVSDDTPGYDLLTPVLFLVTEENVVTDTVPVRAFSLQVITKDWYQDTDHGPAVPLIPPIDNTFRRPAPLVQTIALGESARQLADGSWTYALTGDVTFTPYDGQRARVWRRHPTTEIRAVVMNPATDIFSNAFNNFVNGDQVVFLAGDDALPAENSLNVVGTVLYVVNATSSGFQVSATLAGSPLGFVGTFRIRAHVLSDWEGPGITLIPDIAQHAVFEIVPAQLGQHFVKAVTENRVGASFPFDSHPQFIEEIVVQQINPNPPMNMRSTFDGTRIRWTWDPSTTKDVTSYRVTDEFDRLIAITFVPEYSEVRTTEPIITRRVYAVTNIGAVSSLFATFSFVLPFRFAWTDLHETVSQDDHTLKVISATGTYRGATLSTALIMQPVQNRVYVAPHKNNVSQGIALDVGRTWFPDAFYIAVYFNADGTFGTVPGNSSFGSYVVGEEYVIDITPGTTCKLYRRKTVGHTIIETVVHDYGVDPSTGGASHMYVRGFTSAGIGTVIDLLPLLVGNLADNIQTIVPTAQNLVNASYNSTTGNAARTGGTGWGSSGLSIDGIPADQAGGFYFQATGGLGITGGQGTTVGLSNTDPDQNTTSMPFRVVCNDDGSLDTYNNNTLLDHNPTPSAGGVSGLLGVESIFIGRTQHGNLFVSVDDAPIFTWLSTPTSLKNNALVLDIAFNGSIGTHWTVLSIVVIKPFTTQLTPAGNVPQLAMQLVENAHIGENPVYNIPPFAISNPLTGQYLTFDASGNVINTTAPSVTTDPVWTAKGDLLAGTGAGAAAIRSVGANNLVLTADSSLSTGIKWANPLTVGRAVSGGAANRVAYLDGSQNFATSANLLFDGNKLTVGVAAIIDSPGSGDIFIGSAHGGGYTGVLTTAIGVGAGAAITTASENTLVGYAAGGSITTGTGNTCVGYASGLALTSGQLNVLLGYQAAPGITTGGNNVAIGVNALLSNIIGNSNVAIGIGAGQSSLGDASVFIGAGAGQGQTGTSNNYIGAQCGLSAGSGSYNTGVGQNTLLSTSSGSLQTAIGYDAGFSITTASNGVFLGAYAGFSNTGGSGVFVGYQAGYSETAANRLYISNSSTTTPLIYGEFDNQVLYFTGREIRQRYDASNYLKTTIGATGSVTFDSVGSGAGFTFNNPTTFNGDINLGSNDINSINDLFAATLSAGTLRCIGFTSSAGNPTTTQLTTNKDFGIHRNTSSGDVFLAYNDSGTIKKVLLT